MGNFRLREFRKSQGLYQDELAKILNITQSSMSRMETNNIILQGEMLDVLRERFGKEAVDEYIIPAEEEHVIKFSDEPISPSVDNLIAVIQKLADTAYIQITEQNKYINRLSDMNERLLSIMEKMQIG